MLYLTSLKEDIFLKVMYKSKRRKIMKTYIAKSEKDTIALAKNLAKSLTNKDIVVLSRGSRCRKDEIH